MFEFLIGGLVGLILGWLFIPAPAFVTNAYKRWFGGED